MDTKRKIVKDTTRKYTKNNIKICGAESLKSSGVTTPQQPKNCRTPLMSRKNRTQDDYDGYNSEEASPVLLSTQEGGRGCEVTWDWRSPNRNERTPRNTPKEKARRRVHHKNNVSPLLQLPCKRKLQQPANKNFFDNLHAQLADIQQKFYSNKTGCSNKASPKSDAKKSPKTDILRIPQVEISRKELIKSPEKCETSGISEFFRDDSFTDYLIMCSQVAESSTNPETKIVPDLNKNNVTRNRKNKTNQPENRSPELFFDDEKANFQLPEVHKTPKLSNVETSVRDKQFKNLSTKSPKFGNDDSFDALLSTFSEDAFTASEYSNHKQYLEEENASDYDIKNIILKNMNECSSQNIGTLLNFTTNLQPIAEDDEHKFKNIKNISKSTENKSLNISATKVGLSRHNSMPISPRIVGSNFQQGSIGRHNSMPYRSKNRFNNQRQRSLSDRTDSLESLGSQSSSPIQCTPDEIEKKRQNALRKKEARRIKQEIERKRLEAKEKLQMKTKSQIHKNTR